MKYANYLYLLTVILALGKVFYVKNNLPGKLQNFI